MTRKLATASVLLIFLICGCARDHTRLQVESFKQSAAREYTEQFETGVFALDAHRNWDLVFEVPPIWTPATQPATSQAASPGAGGTWYLQLLHIKVFWTPQPGRTYAESTQTNAAIRYYFFMGSEVMTYEGAGFVYFSPPAPGEQFIGRLESASLRPARKTSAANDLLGPCRLTGTFLADEDLRKVRASLQNARRKLPALPAPAK